MDDAFYDSIVGSLDDAKRASDLIDGLMVGAVSGNGCTVGVSKTGTRSDERGMELICFVPGVAVGFFDVLADSAAEEYIDDLHAFTDAKYRALPFDKQLQRLKLGDIQFYIYIAGAQILLSEKGGRDIAATGQK